MNLPLVLQLALGFLQFGPHKKHLMKSYHLLKTYAFENVTFSVSTNLGTFVHSHTKIPLFKNGLTRYKRILVDKNDDSTLQLRWVSSITIGVPFHLSIDLHLIFEISLKRSQSFSDLIFLTRDFKNQVQVCSPKMITLVESTS